MKKIGLIIFILFVLSGCMKVQTVDIKEFSYSSFDVNIFESEEVRLKFSVKQVSAEEGEIIKAQQIFNQLQSASSYAANEKDLVEKIVLNLNAVLDYDTDMQFYSTCSALALGKGTCFHYSYTLCELLRSFGFSSNVCYAITSKGPHVFVLLVFEDTVYYIEPTDADKNMEVAMWNTEEQMKEWMGFDSFNIVY